MHPVLFRRWGIEIHSYLALLYFGINAGIVAGNLAAHASGLDAFRVYVATCVLIALALVGARLLHVMSHWKFYRHNRKLVWRRSQGVLALYGGLILALPLSLRLSWGAFWDVAVFTILVGMMFTKIGCLLNGCCRGHLWNSRFAIAFPTAHGGCEKRLPSQLLEFGWAGLLLIIAALLRSRMPFPGALFLFMTGAYAGGRLALESLREHEPGSASFGIQSWISLAAMVISAVVLGVLAAQ
jgi:phosphatidylglycerol---prolipoprotein diacylglyceryl transferase